MLKLLGIKQNTNYCQAMRDPDEEGDYLVFEQLMAEANAKKEKKDDKKEKEKKHHFHHHHAKTDEKTAS